MATFFGIITNIMRLANNTDGVPFRATPLASLSVAQTESPYLEKTRSGMRFSGGLQLLANGIAPLQAIPTTTASLSLFNSDTSGSSYCFDIDWLNVFLASGTAAAGLTVFVCVAKPTTVPSASVAGYGVSNASSSTIGSKAIWSAGLALPANTVWTPLASTLQTAGANIGQGDNFADLGGRFVVPPQYALCIAILSGAGTSPLYGVGVQWGEQQETLI